jgi:hypothetical protein
MQWDDVSVKMIGIISKYGQAFSLIKHVKVKLVGSLLGMVLFNGRVICNLTLLFY